MLKGNAGFDGNRAAENIFSSMLSAFASCTSSLSSPTVLCLGCACTCRVVPRVCVHAYVVPCHACAVRMRMRMPRRAGERPYEGLTRKQRYGNDPEKLLRKILRGHRPTIPPTPSAGSATKANAKAAGTDTEIHAASTDTATVGEGGKDTTDMDRAGLGADEGDKDNNNKNMKTANGNANMNGGGREAQHWPEGFGEAVCQRCWQVDAADR